MKKHKKGLDIHGCVYYHRRVRAKGTALREHCDDAGDCVKYGNFCGVCPVIGRLRQTVCGVYRRCMALRPANVGLFSCERSDTHG